VEGVVRVERRAPKAGALPTGSPFRSGKGSASKKVSHLLAEQLLNNRLQIGVFQRKWEGRNTNKTYENRSVRIGKGELSNRRPSRSPLHRARHASCFANALPKVGMQSQHNLEVLSVSIWFPIKAFARETKCRQINRFQSFIQSFPSFGRNFDCAPTVQESKVFIPFGLAFERKQVPRFVGKVSS